MAVKGLMISTESPAGTAQKAKSDSDGNLKTRLGYRNQLITYATDTVPSGGTKSVISRFSNIKDYSAITVAIVYPSTTTFTASLNWYIQTEGQTNGAQVEQVRLAEALTGPRFSSAYLEIHGTQFTVILGNPTGADISATVFVMGIR